MATAGEQLASGPSVEAVINYVVDTGEKVVNVPSTAGGGKSSHIGQYEEKTVPVTDARSMVPELSIDREGFALVPHETSCSDFFDPDVVAREYNPEIEALIKLHTGAKDVMVFDHTVRAGDEIIRKTKMVREPVQRAHNDYTIRSGPMRVQDWFGEEQSKPLLERRFAIINIWRSISGAVETMPLAICDARSVVQGDLIAAERRAKERIGETYRLAHNPNHQWFYFPLMQKNEAMLIKSYESEDDGRARFTPHTAFADPTTPSGATPRQSIETRVFAFF